MSHAARANQNGAALVIGLIMLVLITLMLITALNLGTTNFRAVANMQYRSEAVAAANKAIEQVMSTPFTAAPAAETVNVDIDNDADTDYEVQVAVASRSQTVFQVEEADMLTGSDRLLGSAPNAGEA